MTAGRPLSIARGAISGTQKSFYEAVFDWRFDGTAISIDGRPVAVCGLPVDASGWLTVLSVR